MFVFLKRLLGTSPEHQEAERRYQKSIETLNQELRELDKLQEALQETCTVQEVSARVLKHANVDLSVAAEHGRRKISGEYSAEELTGEVEEEKNVREEATQRRSGSSQKRKQPSFPFGDPDPTPT